MTAEGLAHIREVLSWWTKGPDCPGQAPAVLAWSVDGKPMLGLPDGTWEIIEADGKGGVA